MPTSQRTVTIAATVFHGSGLVHQEMKGAGETYVSALDAALEGLGKIITPSLTAIDENLDN